MKHGIKNVFVNRNAQLRSGWKIVITLAVYLVIALAMVALAGAVYGIWGRAVGMSTEQILKNVDLVYNGDPVFSIIRTVLVTTGAICAVLLTWRLLDNKPAAELGFVGFKKAAPRFLKGLAAGAVSMCLVFAILLLTKNVTVTGSLAKPDISPSLLSGLLVFIGVGLSEESFSRGYCIAVLRQTGNKVVILLVASLIFSLLHVLNANVSLVGLINIFLVGILLSLMFMRTGNLWLSIGFHTTWNYFQGSVFGLEVSGANLSGMYHTRLEAANLINGGAFGPEGGLAVTLVIAVGIGIEFLLLWRQNRYESWNRTGQPSV